MSSKTLKNGILGRLIMKYSTIDNIVIMILSILFFLYLFILLPLSIYNDIIEIIKSIYKKIKGRKNVNR